MFSNFRRHIWSYVWRNLWDRGSSESESCQVVRSCVRELRAKGKRAVDIVKYIGFLVTWLDPNARFTFRAEQAPLGFQTHERDYSLQPGSWKYFKKKKLAPNYFFLEQVNVGSNFSRILRSTRSSPTGLRIYGCKSYTATCLLSRKLSKLDEPGTQDTAGGAGTSS